MAVLSPWVRRKAPFWKRSAPASGRTMAWHGALCRCRFWVSMLVGRWLYLGRVGDDEISVVGPTELQRMWFGPPQACPQLFLFTLVLPQVFQIVCLHSCFCSVRNRHKNPKARPPLTAHPCAKKAKAVATAVRNKLSAGPCEPRQQTKNNPSLPCPPKRLQTLICQQRRPSGGKGGLQSHDLG